MLHERFLNSVKITSVDFEKLRRSLSEIAKTLREKHPEVEDILLFGSFARGDYTPESDIDILIISTCEKLPFLLRSERFADLFRSLPFDVNILVYTREEIHRMKEEGNPFIMSVLAEAQPL